MVVLLLLSCFLVVVREGRDCKVYPRIFHREIFRWPVTAITQPAPMLFNLSIGSRFCVQRWSPTYSATLMPQAWAGVQRCAARGVTLPVTAMLGPFASKRCASLPWTFFERCARSLRLLRKKGIEGLGVGAGG